MPEKSRFGDHAPDCVWREPQQTWQLLQPESDGKAYNVIQLIYRSKDHEGGSKDHEFSRRSMEDHWAAGYHDTIRTLRHPEVLARPIGADGVLTFDLAAHARM